MWMERSMALIIFSATYWMVLASIFPKQWGWCGTVISLRCLTEKVLVIFCVMPSFFTQFSPNLSAVSKIFLDSTWQGHSRRRVKNRNGILTVLNLVNFVMALTQGSIASWSVHILRWSAHNIKMRAMSWLTRDENGFMYPCKEHMSTLWSCVPSFPQSKLLSSGFLLMEDPNIPDVPWPVSPHGRL